MDSDKEAEKIVQQNHLSVAFFVRHSSQFLHKANL